MSADKVAVRGFGVSRTGEGGTAQELFWFMEQAGLTEITKDLSSNLNQPETLAALQTLFELHEASMSRQPAIGNSFYDGSIAIQRLSPTHCLALYTANPDLLKDSFGMFAPQRDVNSTPVAHGFINGLAITEASTQKDLAWEFISLLMGDEYVLDVQKAAGWIGGRTDIANRMADLQPGISYWYDLFEYLRAPMIPPPRNTSQNELGALMLKVYNMQMSPQVALEESHKTWTRLLADWKLQIKP